MKLNLVAAVHLGEEEYYAALNEYFTTQDVVLYELVAEANQIPVQGAAGSTSLIGFMQQSLARFLNVGFQLNEIDYSPSNFLHADLTPSQLEALMASKDENFLSMFLSLAMAQMAEQSAVSDDSMSSLSMLSLLRALNSQNQNNAFQVPVRRRAWTKWGRNSGCRIGAATHDIGGSQQSGAASIGRSPTEPESRADQHILRSRSYARDRA